MVREIAVRNLFLAFSRDAFTFPFFSSPSYLLRRCPPPSPIYGIVVNPPSSPGDRLAPMVNNATWLCVPRDCFRIRSIRMTKTQGTGVRRLRLLATHMIQSPEEVPGMSLMWKAATVVTWIRKSLMPFQLFEPEMGSQRC